MKNRILLSLLMIAGSAQAKPLAWTTTTSSYTSSCSSDYDTEYCTCYDNDYDYDADDIAICQSILKYNIEFLKSLIVPDNEMNAIKLLAPEIDFSEYCVEYFETSTFIHLLSSLLEQDTVTTLNSNFSATEIAQYTSKVMNLMKHAIKIGIDVNAINCFGETALSGAVEYGAFDATMLLIQSGADVNCVNEVGMTPLFLAIQNSCNQYDDYSYFASKNEASKPFVMISNIETVRALLAAGTKTTVTLNGQSYEFSQCLDEAIANINYELHGWNADPALLMLKDELVAIKFVADTHGQIICG